MNVTLLDGGTSAWKPHLNQHKPLERASSYHLLARDLISKIYYSHKILEEVTVPLTAKSWCLLDFYIPLVRIAVEVQGEQHYKFCLGFHKDYRDFLYGQKKDRDKRQWLELNGIELIELPYNESEDQWTRRLKRI